MAAGPVLIVDDNEANLKVARLALESEGFHVRVASSGEEAIALLRTFRPRLILLDIRLPGLDGLEVARRVKADSATRDNVIIAGSAYAENGDRDRALEAGCDGYITKPLDPIRLPLQIAEYLGQGAEAAPRRDETDRGGDAEPVPGAVASEARAPILLVEDNPTTRKMFRVTLESAGHRVVEAHDGRTALD
ncbi:MAG: response regulator, partial [Gaiellaceae bacterium]